LLIDTINAALLNHFHGWTFYRLTTTLLATQQCRYESRMVIFFLIKRTVWDRYLQVVIVKLDDINVVTLARTTRGILFHFISFHRQLVWHFVIYTKCCYERLNETGWNPLKHQDENHINSCCLYYSTHADFKDKIQQRMFDW